MSNQTDTPPVPADQAQPEPPKSLMEALLAFQADPPVVIKNDKAVVKDKAGKDLYEYDFLNLSGLLSAIQPTLSELGLLWQTKTGETADGRPVIYWKCTHVGSGESEEGTMSMVGSGGTMQGLGGSISFARRYCTITYFGLAPDKDEDGATATAEAAAAKTKGAAADKPITKARAERILAKAKAVGVLSRMQLVASRAAGQDVGPCDSMAKATAAMRKLTGAQADKVESWLEEKAQEALDAAAEGDQSAVGA